MTNTEAITQLHHFLYEGDTRTRTAAPKPQRQGKKPEAQDEAATAAPKPAPVKITGPTLAGSRKKRRIAYLLLGLVLLLFFPGYPVLHLANQFLPSPVAKALRDGYAQIFGIEVELVEQAENEVETTPEPLPAEPLPDPTIDKVAAKTIQSRLAELGYYKSAIDGAWGRGSAGALRKFKLANNLPDNAEWNRETQEVLFSDQAKGPTDLRR